MNPALNPVNVLIDAMFPPMATPQTPDWIDLDREDDAKRAAHVAEVLPQLIRLYSVTPDRIADGIDAVAMRAVKNHPALIAAIAHRDHAEIGRLLLVGIDARIAAVAEDAATDEAYDLIPERAIP